MFDLSQVEIVSNFNSFINRMRLISERDFNGLSTSKKIEAIFELNEDQLSGRDRNCFRQMQPLDFTMRDLSDAIQQISTDSEKHEELIIWTSEQYSETLQNKAQAILEQKIKTPVHIIFKTDPGLILGCKIKFRHQDYDLSFQGQALTLINQSILNYL